MAGMASSRSETVDLACGDVAGLVQALASPAERVTVNLNSDHVAGCTYTFAAPYAPGAAQALPPVGPNEITGTTQVRVTINGNGSTLARSSSSTDPFSLLATNPGAVLDAQDLTLTGGDVFASASAQQTAGAGGLNNGGVATLRRCTVSGNVLSAGPRNPGSGGGIDNGGTLTLIDSTVSGNRISASTFGPPVDADGGGIYSAGGSVTVIDSTISDNSVSAYPTMAFGGGIDVTQGTLLLRGSTVTGNSALADGGGIEASIAAAVAVSTRFSGNTPDNCGPRHLVVGCHG